MDYEDHVWDGSTESPTLFLDDLSAIPFLVHIAGVEEYQHRARVRASDGDLFAAVTPPAPGYEEYCRDVLRMGSPELVLAEPAGEPIEVTRACLSGAAFRQIVDRARGAGGLLLHPYMSIEPVWELAARVAVEAGVPAQVIGPPPPVLWVANDKKRFGELVEEVLGGDWLVPTLTAREPARIAQNLEALARKSRRVGLKRTRCASATGNRVLDSEELLTRGSAFVESAVRAFLEHTEWDGREDVLAVAWEDATHSPSTQTWIPPRGRGAPRVGGLYEQILDGEEKVFVGSRPSRLSPAVHERLSKASLELAGALQELGYAGRCSFDFLVLEEERLVVTECNGRWGGTSIPMSMVDRLVKGSRPPYRAQDFVHEGLVGATIGDLLLALGESVYRTAEGSGRFLFYNVGPLAKSGKLDVIALGKTQDEAERGLLEELPRRLGLGSPSVSE
jgi:hypothetical protein